MHCPGFPPSLIKIVNGLHDQLRNGSVDSALLFDNLFGEMLDYANYHFKREEELMRLCNYKDFDRHKAVHAKYRDLTEWGKDTTAGPNSPTSMS